MTERAALAVRDDTRERPIHRCPVGDGAEPVSDEVLLVRVRDGDDRALTELLDRYRGSVRAKARAYFLVGGDREDVVQEAMIGLYKAVRDFSHDRGTSFRAFAELCITRQILTAIRTATRQKHVPLNSYVPFDRPHDDDPERAFGDAVSVEAAADPLDLLVEHDDLRRLQASFGEVLTGLEVDVLLLYVEGRSYQEIAAQLGRRVKSIDNALQRIKRKLEHHLGH